MAYSPEKGTEALNKLVAEYGEKIKTQLLPPDPARMIDNIAGIGVRLEHILPIPPIAETVHNFLHNLVETKLPRLPQMSAFEKEEFKTYPETTETGRE